MSLLAGQRVVAIGDASRRPLVRLLASMGASVEEATLAGLGASVAGASFLVEGLGLPRLDDAGWTRERIEALNPALIHASVTTFGSHGPRSRWRGGELVASATGGTLLLTGEPDRPPVKEALDACTFHADMVAASGMLAAHAERSASGLGQHVDVSIQQVAASRLVNSVLVWHFDRRKLHRVGGALNYGLATVRCIWPLADGWCFHTLMTGRFGAPANQALSDWMDETGNDNPMRGTDWIRYNRSTLDPQLRARWEAGIAAFFRSRTRAEVSTEGRRRGINATVLAEPSDVLADPHLDARHFWAQRDGRREAARFFTVLEPERPVAATASTPATRRPGPLAGVRVLDFSWALVGSMTTKTLGDLGADVIKVESRTRPCLTRLDVQVSASKPGNFDDKPWFAHLNTSKRSLALDMKQPESRELIRPLVEWADIVVENFSPGTMAKLGLDYDRLCQLNPGIIMVSGSVFGQSGPLAQEWGVDGTGGALSGRTFLTGWPDRDPLVPGAVPYGDVIVPYVMAAAAAGALARRRTGGAGCHIDASMYEICVQQMAGAFALAQAGQRPRRMGNADQGVFLQGVFPVAARVAAVDEVPGTPLAHERWIAISCKSPSDWDALRLFAGLPDIEDAAGREATLAAWTAGQEGPALAERLQAAGIAAGVLQDIEDVLEHDPQLATMGLLVPLEHAVLGTFGHVATPLRLSRSQPAPYRAPSIGEHSREIALQLAGLAPSRFEELQAKGVFQ